MGLQNLQGFGLILSSIHWREAWKYGERSLRYCNHDVGHALGALRFSASLPGWQFRLHPQVGDEQLDQLLGFDRIEWPENEEEQADCLCWVSVGYQQNAPWFPEKRGLADEFMLQRYGY